MPDGANSGGRRDERACPAESGEAARISIELLRASTRFSLRLSSQACAVLSSIAGFRVDMPTNRCVASGDRISARLGPDEWLLLGAREDSAYLARALTAALGDELHSLVDVSDRNVAIAVAGSHAREIVNAGCPLDLDDASFGTGCATRTVLGKAQITLLRPGSAYSYRIECWRSFAPYVYGLLTDAARELVSS